jgi:membrane protease YdiL (CAAX protease family)
MALSITAGFCEELIYRGFVVWALAPALGLYGAAATSVIIFGISHMYQGRAGTIRATLTGAVLAALALATHSVIPGMVLHAIVDLASGYTAYTLLAETALAGSPA